MAAPVSRRITISDGSGILNFRYGSVGTSSIKDSVGVAVFQEEVFVENSLTTHQYEFHSLSQRNNERVVGQKIYHQYAFGAISHLS